MGMFQWRDQNLVAKTNRGKVALITGVTGQDGAYLSELLLSKGYVVHGINDDPRHSIQNGSSTCMRIRKRPISVFSCITAT